MEEGEHWGQQVATSCQSLPGWLEVPPFIASAAAWADQSCRLGPHHGEGNRHCRGPAASTVALGLPKSSEPRQ